MSFNPRPRAGGDQSSGRGAGARVVSIHAPARGRLAEGLHPLPFHRFNPRPRAGGDPISGAGLISLEQFQSTPPRGGRQVAFLVGAQLIGGFNPRPRAGGDPSLPWSTLARLCFNPRPRAGGDVARDLFGRRRAGFNPRPRAGGDKRSVVLLRAFCDVSIHAPARGATSGGLCHNRARSFQSTPPRGGDRDWNAALNILASFNPRPRAGGDGPVVPHGKRRQEVSIHAPARGATRSEPRNCLLFAKFQSTPPRGGRP